MYCPRTFEEERTESILDLIASHPLATIVTAGSGGMTAEHVPLIHEPEESGWGTLVGHVARANPVWRSEESRHLLVFQGPQAYVSPGWYPTKQVDPRVVPTWNYAVVHVTASMTTFDEPEALLSLVRQLSDRHEAAMPQPWSVDDAPADYIEKMCRAIVGVRFRVIDLKAKFKLSQNQSDANRSGVLEGLGQAPAAAFMRQWASGPKV
ncbi:FMN-binding negative transcriptional regulator [Hydrogenophaga sp. 5NK40-0174]